MAASTNEFRVIAMTGRAAKPEFVHDLEDRFVVTGRSYQVHVVVDDRRKRPTVIANDDFDGNVSNMKAELR